MTACRLCGLDVEAAEHSPEVTACPFAQPCPDCDARAGEPCEPYCPAMASDSAPTLPLD